AARQEGIGLLTLDQSFGTRLRVTERHALTCDMVEVRAYGGRHAEVVHRHREDDGVSVLQLFDQRVGFVRDDLLLRRTVLWSRVERLKTLCGEMRQRIRVEVAHDHASIRMSGSPTRDEAI